MICRITQQMLAPHASDLLTGLFAALQKPNSNENEYVMKAIMRSFNTLNELTMSYMAVALPRLTEILTLVSKNPSKPHFNHYLFETLSLAVKIVCKVEPNAVASFEEALFPVFQHILQEDIMGIFVIIFFVQFSINSFYFRIPSLRFPNVVSTDGDSTRNRQCTRTLLGPLSLPAQPYFVGASRKYHTFDPSSLHVRSPSLTANSG